MSASDPRDNRDLRCPRCGTTAESGTVAVGRFHTCPGVFERIGSASDPRNRSVEDLVVGDRVVTNGKERTLTGIERVATDARYGDYFRLDFGTEAVFYYGQTIVSVRGDAASDPSGAEVRSPNELVAIEVSFATPVAISREQERRLYALVDEIARANEPEGCVHWLSGGGHKPRFSQADSRFLGKPVDLTAPERGEPTFDSSILALETCCRER